MSQDKESTQNKTEEPTSKKLRDLRKRGEVPNSRDFTVTMSMIVSLIASIFLLRTICTELTNMLEHVVTLKMTNLDSTKDIAQFAQKYFLRGLLCVMPFVVLAVCTSTVVGFLQVKGLVAFEQVKPKLDRINPVTGIKRIFSLHSIVELIKLLVKALLLFSIAYLLLRNMLPVLLNARFLSAQSWFVLSGSMLATLMWTSLTGFFLLALFDMWFQRWNYQRRNRMSKDEVRREHKETEGDPHIRGKRRQIQHESSMQNMLDSVRRANVVIVHLADIAVALYYDKGETKLPVVLAKGEVSVANAIRDIAEERRIPILQDAKLARQLLDEAHVNQYVPDNLLEPIAAAMRWVRDSRFTEKN